MPKHRVYIEPYGGAASVLLRKDRSYAEIYNDLDGDVVNLFRVLRDSEASSNLATLLTATPFARDELVEAYADSCDPLERARRLVVRSMMGFGSDAATGRTTGFRANSNRSGTTPAKDWETYPPILRAVTERLRGVTIENRPALMVIEAHASPEALIYVDPPYLPETRARKWRKNYRHEMSKDDHITLLEALLRTQAKVMVSGYTAPLYEDMLRDWRRVERSALADGARERTEVLWMNFEVPFAGPLFDPKTQVKQ